MRAAVDHLFREGRLLVWGVPATGVLVETLLDRGADSDVAEAEAAIDRLATRQPKRVRLSATSGCCGCGLCWRGLTAIRQLSGLRDRYRDMAKTLGFEGHIEWAEAMP